MGRDIIGVCKNDPNLWDNYQCKHYKNALKPTDIWIELGKLVYYTYRKEYTYPRKYYFVAPQGAGTTLSNLLKKPIELKQELIKNWDKYCKDNITAKSKVELDATLKAYLDTLDFSIFEAIPPLLVIEQHSSTRYHIARFGLGLPGRPPVPDPPEVPTVTEAQYIRHLLDAYADLLKIPVPDISNISHDEKLCQHYSNSRKEFYSAEALRMFSRDTLPAGTFEDLQDQMYDGIYDEWISDHTDGFVRLLAVIKMAKQLQITEHALVSCLKPRDRGGICHQLANDNRVWWVR